MRSSKLILFDLSSVTLRSMGICKLISDGTDWQNVVTNGTAGAFQAAMPRLPSLIPFQSDLVPVQASAGALTSSRLQSTLCC